MKRVAILTIVTLLSKIHCFGQTTDTLNQKWVNQDIELFSAVKKLDKANPENIQGYFLQFNRNPKIDTLGFDWTMIETGKGAGYCSVNAEFYYYKGKIVTYILHATLPKRMDLVEQYKAIYSEFLPWTDGNKYYFKFEESNILKPLSYYKGKARLINEVRYYMSPYSGTMYGTVGGLPVSELSNRRVFSRLRPNLNAEIITAMMYSINPASRLTAIEYYYKHKDQFKSHEYIDRWIAQVFKAKPTIKTISGCIVYESDSRELVKRLSELAR